MPRSNTRTNPRAIRRWLAKVDDYLLWAFNPQPPLRRSR
jgi:hypothetical protein